MDQQLTRLGQTGTAAVGTHNDRIDPPPPVFPEFEDSEVGYRQGNGGGDNWGAPEVALGKAVMGAALNHVIGVRSVCYC